MSNSSRPLPRQWIGRARIFGQEESEDADATSEANRREIGGSAWESSLGEAPIPTSTCPRLAQLGSDAFRVVGGDSERSGIRVAAALLPDHVCSNDAITSISPTMLQLNSGSSSAGRLLHDLDLHDQLVARCARGELSWADFDRAYDNQYPRYPLDEQRGSRTGQTPVAEVVALHPY
ncbi:MAG: hypothetical protein JWP01_3775 [Myxococcales bacterium]|nr:hypothetical protein [Myxococcales bacterium]